MDFSKYNEDEWKQVTAGLIHGLDYEQFPDQHCTKIKEILEERQWLERIHQGGV